MRAQACAPSPSRSRARTLSGCAHTVDESANDVGVMDEGTVERNAPDVHASNKSEADVFDDEVRPSQIDTSIELTQGTVDVLFSPPGNYEKHH
ncbi:Dynein heavy chain 12 [Phytophthora cinnamomi]|uniref:Dynein heavy chain 12 n=1 Tax=Phytophthora cinnamomi TaxID=4785 RepID=UPI003559D993|nr:Dynein heavy chain 12 [Phytophthora cinnamomi]